MAHRRTRKFPVTVVRATRRAEKEQERAMMSVETVDYQATVRQLQAELAQARAERDAARAEAVRLRAASADLVFSTRQMLVVLGRIARNQDHPDIHMTEVEFLQASVDRLHAALAAPGGEGETK